MLELDFRKRMGRFSMDIRLQAGDEAVALLGASGAGKSMTLKCIAGVERPDAGRIVLDGRVLFDAERGIDLPPQQRGVGLLFQHYALFPQMTVARNIMTGLHALPRGERAAHAAALIARFHLQGLENRLPGALSGGQQQRTALARMLAARPRLLLFDEPFAALDSYLRWELEQVVAEIIAAHAGTALFVSHNRDEAYRLCPAMAVLDDGRVSVCDTREGLFARPRTQAAALLTGCKNIAPAHAISAHLLDVPDWGLRLHTQQDALAAAAVGLRAHALDLGDGENAFDAQVCQVVDGPFSVIYRIQPVGSHALLRWETGKHGAPLQPGAQVRMTVRAADVLPLCGNADGA